MTARLSRESVAENWCVVKLVQQGFRGHQVFLSMADSTGYESARIRRVIYFIQVCLSLFLSQSQNKKIVSDYMLTIWITMFSMTKQSQTDFRSCDIMACCVIFKSRLNFVRHVPWKPMVSCLQLGTIWEVDVVMLYCSAQLTFFNRWQQGEVATLLAIPHSSVILQ